MRKFNPFYNVGTSEVFFVIAKGISSGADIINYLNIQKSAVYEQIRRLEKIKLIRKKPKRKGFEIDWEEFYSLFLDKLINDHYGELIQSYRNPKYKKKFKKLIRIYVKMREEEILKELISGYISYIAKKIDIKKTNITLKDSLEDFCTAFPVIISKYKSMKIINKKQKTVLKTLIKMWEIFEYLPALAPEALEKSFINLGK